MEEDDWLVPLLNLSPFADRFNCCYGLTFPLCALASAKTLHDNSNFCYNFTCFSCFPALTRSYIRQGYNIGGRIGLADCFSSCCCYPCSVIQLINEVSIRGPIKTPTHDKLMNKIKNENFWFVEHTEFDVLGDPCDFIMSSFTFQFEIIGLIAQLMRAPFWFGCCIVPVNVCQLNHIVRRKYDIPGNECYNDCIKPSILLSIPIINLIFLYKLLASLRAEVGKRHKFNEDVKYYDYDDEDDD